MAAADHGSTMARIATKLTRPPPTMPGEWIGRTLGRYEIRAVLGLGAMGQVYEAYDRDLQRLVALKVLPRKIDPLHQPLGLRMFLQEARAASQIQHPNVVTVYEIGNQDGYYYFAMERVQGITLAALIDQQGPLASHRACYVIAHAAKGLGAGHAIGIVHRDVKPGNIMIDTAGQVKVTDFGLADVRGATNIKESAERVLGTPGWISPEVARGEKPTPASDIYSLGLSLYFAMTRDRIIKADTKSGMIRGQAAARSVERAQLPASWPPRLCDVVLQCLQADPADRYQEAAGLAADLFRALAHDEKDETFVLGDVRRLAGAPAPALASWIALGLLFLLSVAMAAWYWLQR